LTDFDLGNPAPKLFGDATGLQGRLSADNAAQESMHLANNVDSVLGCDCKPMLADIQRRFLAIAEHHRRITRSGRSECAFWRWALAASQLRH
jgi:hypothetical protein